MNDDGGTDMSQEANLIVPMGGPDDPRSWNVDAWTLEELWRWAAAIAHRRKSPRPLGNRGRLCVWAPEGQSPHVDLYFITDGGDRVEVRGEGTDVRQALMEAIARARAYGV